MVNTRNSNAMAEVIYYLKGIRAEDIEKIPKKFMNYLYENASKEYQCNFDYYKPLNELELLDETRGIIGMICYNYWCTTDIHKQEYLKHLKENELLYQKQMRKKYNPDDIFKNKKDNTQEIVKKEEMSLIEVPKQRWYKKIISFLKNIFRVEEKK